VFKAVLVKWDGAGAGAVSMDEHPNATDNAADLLIFTISDEKHWKKLLAAQPARIPILARGLGTNDEAPRIAANVAKLPGLLHKL
jgi:hypothetical protein